MVEKLPPELLTRSLLESFLRQNYTSAENERKNPIIVWQAIYLLISSQTNYANDTRDGIHLPDWITEYLLQVSRSILQMNGCLDPPSLASSTDPTERANALPRALGFVSSGWNAFIEDASCRAKKAEAAFYDAERDRGLTAAEALKSVQRQFGIKSDRQMRKRIAEGQRLARGDRSKPTR